MPECFLILFESDLNDMQRTKKFVNVLQVYLSFIKLVLVDLLALWLSSNLNVDPSNWWPQGFGQIGTELGFF